MSYQLVVFDLDGVLVDTAKLHYAAWQHIFKTRWGVDITPEADDITRGVGRYGCMQLLARHYGVEENEQTLRAVADEKNELYKSYLKTQLGPDSLLPGARQALDYLRDKGIPAALASSSHNAPYILDKLGLGFACIVPPGSVAQGKPAPDIYLAAAAHFNLPPKACIGVEDAVSGVQAVTAAGMYCIGIGDATLLEKSDIAIPTTGQLPQTLAGLLG